MQMSEVSVSALCRVEWEWKGKHKPTSGLHFCRGSGVTEACPPLPPAFLDTCISSGAWPLVPRIPLLYLAFLAHAFILLYKYQLWYFSLAAVAAREMAGLTCAS